MGRAGGAVLRFHVLVIHETGHAEMSALDAVPVTGWWLYNMQMRCDCRADITSKAQRFR